MQQGLVVNTQLYDRFVQLTGTLQNAMMSEFYASLLLF